MKRLLLLRNKLDDNSCDLVVMLILFSLVCALVLCQGCVQVSGTRSPDGSLTVNTHRFFWQSEGIDFSLAGKTNGDLAVTLKVQKSSVDSAAIKAVAEGVAAGMSNSVKP